MRNRIQPLFRLAAMSVLLTLLFIAWVSSVAYSAEPPRFAPPYLGAAYYPEAWPEEQQDQDIALMKDAGINVVRIAEFAWSRMEPEDGKYKFDWLHRVVNKLGEAGIAVIICTPTCTPPAWLSAKHPEILFVHPDGKQSGHGGRRHTCPNNPVYRKYCQRIVEQMAKEFGNDPSIIGWQIDNELAPHAPSRVCACEVCHQKFQVYLQARFGTVEALNKAWCMALWSMDYQSFSQIPIPKPDVRHHPSFLAAWDEFRSDSYIDFLNDQADILHRMATQPVGTDVMPGQALNHYKAHLKLDVVQFNHYNTRESMRDSAFWYDFFRPFKDRPFWVTETQANWTGGLTPGNMAGPGFCRANSWMPIAQGGEANLYWHWRAHRAGQELMFGSVVQSTGRPMYNYAEVQEVAAGYRKCAGFITGTRPVRSGLAITFSMPAWDTFKHQPPINNFDYRSAMINDIYHPLIRAQLRPDVIPPEADLTPYKVVLSPFLPALDEAGLQGKLKSWIEQGGIWIAGPLTDIRDPNGAKFTQSPFGTLEEWGGIYTKYQVPCDALKMNLDWNGKQKMPARGWCDGYELRGAQALASYMDYPLNGLAAVTRRSMGKGAVICVGTLLPPDGWAKLVLEVAAEAGIAPVAAASPNLLAVPREGTAGQGLIAVELEDKPSTLTLTRPATDLLTDERHDAGTLTIPPYGVKVLQYQ